MKQKWLLIIPLVIGAGFGFIGGMQYQRSKQPSFPVGLTERMGRNFRGEVAFRDEGVRAGFGGSVRGEVLRVDEEGFTVKLADESSKIVFTSPQTQVFTAEEGQLEDMAVGQQVMVIGHTNNDGSVSATTVQLNAGVGFRPPEEM